MDAQIYGNVSIKITGFTYFLTNYNLGLCTAKGKDKQPYRRQMTILHSGRGSTGGDSGLSRPPPKAGDLSNEDVSYNSIADSKILLQLFD